MLINLKVDQEYNSGLHEIIRMFFSEARVGSFPVSPELDLDLRAEAFSRGVKLILTVTGRYDARLESGIITTAEKTEMRWAVQRFMYRSLCEITGKNPNPYGVLTGVRPTKLVHALLDRGQTTGDILTKLEEKYLISPEKARLLLEIARTNRPFLPEYGSGKTVSVYAGIPYCPTRCHYCSFPGYDVNHKPGPEEYLPALMKEMEMLGTALRQRDWRVKHLYIGGGTPTLLTLQQWKLWLELINKYYRSPDLVEFTVEAGRPDTLQPEIFEILLQGGVNRICINPQSMNPATLDRIGRLHSPEDVAKAVAAARAAGCSNINMDLIAGLPGEGEGEFLDSLHRILELEPEGITIHVLTRKRGSFWGQEHALTQGGPGGWRSVLDKSHLLLKEAGYVPYYLYRQKFMRENLENVGFARPGFFGLYNINIIEERMTVLGVGAGASSKFVDPAAGNFTSLYHPKEPGAYLNRWKNLAEAQVDKLIALS